MLGLLYNLINTSNNIDIDIYFVCFLLLSISGNSKHILYLWVFSIESIIIKLTYTWDLFLETDTLLVASLCFRFWWVIQSTTLQYKFNFRIPEWLTSINRTLFSQIRHCYYYHLNAFYIQYIFIFWFKFMWR